MICIDRAAGLTIEIVAQDLKSKHDRCKLLIVCRIVLLMGLQLSRGICNHPACHPASVHNPVLREKHRCR